MVSGSFLSEARHTKPNAARQRLIGGVQKLSYGRKANIQVDRPSLPFGEIQPLFRNVCSNGVGPVRRITLQDYCRIVNAAITKKMLRGWELYTSSGKPSIHVYASQQGAYLAIIY